VKISDSMMTRGKATKETGRENDSVADKSSHRCMGPCASGTEQRTSEHFPSSLLASLPGLDMWQAGSVFVRHVSMIDALSGVSNP